MLYILTITILILALFIVRSMIRLHSLSLLLSKDKETANKVNKLEKDYQFIKGLF